METKINEVNANADAVQMQSEMKKRVEKFFLYEKWMFYERKVFCYSLNK